MTGAAGTSGETVGLKIPTGLGFAIAGTLAPPAMAREAQEAERALDLGAVLDVPESDVREVIAAWSEYYRQTLWPLPWSRVREAVVFRAMGEKWWP